MTETTPGSDLAVHDGHGEWPHCPACMQRFERIEAKIDALKEGFDQVVATFQALGATLENDGLAGVMGMMMGGMRA